MFLQETQRKLEEAERLEREKFDNLPDWKKKLLNKKKSSSDFDMNSDTKSEVRWLENICVLCFKIGLTFSSQLVIVYIKAKYYSLLIDLLADNKISV